MRTERDFLLEVLSVTERIVMMLIGIGGLGLALSAFLQTYPYPDSDLLDFVVRLGFGSALIIFTVAYFWKERRG